MPRLFLPRVFLIIVCFSPYESKFASKIGVLRGEHYLPVFPAPQPNEGGGIPSRRENGLTVRIPLDEILVAQYELPDHGKAIQVVKKH